MRFLNRTNLDEDALGEEDPMNGVAQLFDINIAFIVAVIAAVFALQSRNPQLMSQGKATQQEAQSQSVSRKATATKQSGKGKRLGTAYQLDNGEVIYVPDEQN